MADRRALPGLVASIAEMAAPAHRHKLVYGIWSGYAVALGFLVLAMSLSVSHVTAWRWAYFALIAAKLATNSLAWLALARQRAVMLAQGINTMADVVILTIGIYLTGGPASPLLATYVIVVTVLSLLANLGVTILMVLFVLVCFSTMMILLTAGILPPQPVPGVPGHVPSLGYAITSIVLCALIVGVPAFFSSTMLRVLRAREDSLEQRTAQLIQAATQRSQFVASMTHELRTPIHGMQGLSDVIAAGVYGPVTDKQKDACASIKRSAQSLLSLIDDLLALTRAEAGRIDALPGPVDIPTLVERVTASVSWMVGTKQLRLEADIEPDLPAVASDERWLAHVLVNLVSNAVKFTPEGGRVTVRARRHAAAVALEVIDTGIGIAPEDRAVIFEPFRQGERGDAKGYGGVGLGLALVARLTDLLGAEVELESVVGKGSTFRVIVPLEWRGRPTTQLLRPPRARSVLETM
ncbi:MAG TPA: HAMP domain-containing sensor histidine kinase [Kofleriaceae bacterium]|nr:HAMP domain-containing sensor histidine kinase [Kofleriaceae bacterium]